MIESRPHLALLTTALDVSGAERVIALLAQGLSREGYRVTVIGLQRRSGALTRLIQSADVDVIDLDVSGAWDIGAIGRLRRWLVSEHVSVLYTFLFHAHLIGRYAGKLAGTPHIVSSQQVASWGGAARRMLDRWTMRWCDCIVAVSKSVRDDLVGNMQLPPERVRVIANAIDVASFSPATRPFDRFERTGHVVIGSASRLAAEKDHAGLLRGFALARQEMPELRLRLAGSGPLEPQLRRDVIRLGLSDYVEMLGNIADVHGFYESLDVYVQPSRTEGLPCAVIEAMAMGRPVLATDVAGNRDAVVPDVTGLLVRPGRDAAWVDALRLVREPATARQYGEAGQRRAREVFDSSMMISETVLLLRQLLHCKSG